MKKLMFVALTLITSVAFAADVAADKTAQDEKAAKRAASRQKALERSGGLIDRPSAGKVAIVNCQTKYPKAKIEQHIQDLRDALRVNFVLTDGAPIAAATALSRAAAKPDGASVALYLADDAGLPISLYAMEGQWCIVNFSALNESQCEKEFVRGASLVLGCAMSQSKSSPMQTVATLKDFDRVISTDISFDSLGGILTNMENLGITQSRKTSYRKACMEGWAPAPTNDYQKVIWEEIHAKPTNPIKIKFDPKKGE